MEDGSGHAVLAYDIIDQPDGSADVLVHDSNVPFDGNELGVNGLVHKDRTRAPERDPDLGRPFELGARHGRRDVARRRQDAVRVRPRRDR